MILVGIGVYFAIKESATKSLSKEVYKEENNNESVKEYVEHIVNPDGMRKK